MASSAQPPPPPPTSSLLTSVNPVDANLQRNVYVRILEEPASKALRFRYECEGRSAGSLPGANSTQDKKTFPKIQVLGYRGRAVVVVSCVTIDPPYRPHPHNLVGKEGCKKGVCTMEIANEDMTCEFSNLGIQCVKKKDIEDSLKVREEIRVDPFRTGFHHKSQPGSIDLNSVRLCFQVFLEGPERGQFKVPLKPVVSEPIYDKKAINDLTIMKLSDCTSPVMGNREVILLCDKVSKDDIEVRFYEENEETGAVVWESFGDFQPSDVHKQYAICFRTPQYHNLEITSPAHVYIQLRCPSKDTTSAPRPFQYIPLLTSGSCKRKWNLVSFSGAYGSYMSNQQQGSGDSASVLNSVAKKQKPLDLEDILANDSVAIASLPPDATVLPFEAQQQQSQQQPIYDRLNEFMSVGKDTVVGMETGQSTVVAIAPGSENVENIYDVDLELITQIIRGQQDGGGVGMVTSDEETILADAIVSELVASGGGDVFNDIVMDVDAINGNGGEVTMPQLQTSTPAQQVKIEQQEQLHTAASTTTVTEQINANDGAAAVTTTTTPPTRPPKSQKAPPPPVVDTTTTAAPPAAAPPLPPKKTTPKQSPTKQSPATFLKNLLFSPTKKNKQDKNKQQAVVVSANANNNVNTTTVSTIDPLLSSTVVVGEQQPLLQQQQTSLDPSTGNYEFTENMALYVDNDAPLATASEFGDDDLVVMTTSGQRIQDDDANTELKRKRQKLENSRTLYQYFEHNKRPRQNSYPPVNSPPGAGGGVPTPPLHPDASNMTSPPPPSPQQPLLVQPAVSSTLQQQQLPPQQSPSSLYTPQQSNQHQPPPQPHHVTQTQPIQLLHSPPPPTHQHHHHTQNPLLQQQVYIKQEPQPIPQYLPPQNQYYYDLMMMAAPNNTTTRPNLLAQQQQAAAVAAAAAAALQYSGGGIIKDQNVQQDHLHQQQDQDNGNIPQLNSDISLPNLSDVNLSLLDQHLSENLNDMNLNNF